MRLADRVVAVTGGSRGLGRAIALEAAREGARVVVGYRRREREALEVVAEAGAGASAIALDVRDPASVEAFFARVLETHGTIDGLVTSAGIVSDGWLATTPLERWDDVVTTNLRGTMLSIRGVLRAMMAKKRGSIVALASVTAMRANPGQASYAASKGGIVAMVRTLAAEVGRYGIRVNALAPGLFDAGMLKATPPAHKERMREHIPLGRFGDARELARAAVFLLSDDASYVTGHTLVVDGGLSA
ncbi:MAG TPA: SDR family oxidoreductase [Sandaracinaceae bacterium]